MDELISMLLHAQKVTQVHHWKCGSFARHIALGELYDALVKHTDTLVEIYMGKYGTDLPIPLGFWHFSETDAQSFVGELFSALDALKERIPQDDWLLNQYEELQASVSRAK